MRGAAILLGVAALAGCAPAAVVPTVPLAPPADVATACALPEVEGDAFLALVTHRLALVECRGAALLNAGAWALYAGALAGPR